MVSSIDDVLVVVTLYNGFRSAFRLFYRIYLFIYNCNHIVLDLAAPNK